MNKLIGILLRLAASVIYVLARTAVLALAINPSELNGLEEDMALLVVEVTDAMSAVGTLAAIERATA